MISPNLLSPNLLMSPGMFAQPKNPPQKIASKSVAGRAPVSDEGPDSQSSKYRGCSLVTPGSWKITLYHPLNSNRKRQFVASCGSLKEAACLRDFFMDRINSEQAEGEPRFTAKPNLSREEYEGVVGDAFVQKYLKVAGLAHAWYKTVAETMKSVPVDRMEIDSGAAKCVGDGAQDMECDPSTGALNGKGQKRKNAVAIEVRVAGKKVAANPQQAPEVIEGGHPTIRGVIELPVGSNKWHLEFTFGGVHRVYPCFEAGKVGAGRCRDYILLKAGFPLERIALHFPVTEYYVDGALIDHALYAVLVDKVRAWIKEVNDSEHEAERCSKFEGVEVHQTKGGNRWRIRVDFDQASKKFPAVFSTPESAALARDYICLKLGIVGGRGRRLNFDRSEYYKDDSLIEDASLAGVVTQVNVWLLAQQQKAALAAEKGTKKGAISTDPGEDLEDEDVNLDGYEPKNFKTPSAVRPPESKQTCIDKFLEAIKDGPTYACACCSQMWFKRGVRELTSEKIDEWIKDCQDVILETESHGARWICNTCLIDLNKQKIPTLASCNIYFPPVPKILTELTDFEQSFVVPVFPFLRVRALQSGGQKSLVGTSVACVPMDTAKVQCALPRAMADT